MCHDLTQNPTNQPTLVAFSLPAYSGGIDGKFIRCLGNKSPGNAKWFSFQSNNFIEHHISDSLPLKIVKTRGENYRVYPHDIKTNSWVLNRSTLTLKRSFRTSDFEQKYTCELMSKDQIQTELQELLNYLKKLTKKNKI